LAACITGGYKRVGKAVRFNNTKKRFKNVTIGLPLFFTRYIYTKVNDKMFKVDFSLMQIKRKFKAKKKIKKKINKKKKKKKRKKKNFFNIKQNIFFSPKK